MRAVNRLVALVVTLAVPFIVWWKAEALMDWWRLRDYTPPAAVSALTKDDTMTSYATHIFYVNHPDIETNAGQFRSDCNETEQTIVLGCYHSDQDGIYIYDVTDPRLGGVEQVTAAHEMLHAAYDRLSSGERNYIDGQLENFYDNGLHDQRVIQTIEAYKKTEPNDVVNEMHSVFGTEVANLPSTLENYYKRYFSDREKVVRYAASYQSEFTGREAEIKADDAQLARRLAVIDQQKAALGAQSAKIDSDRQALNAERNNGSPSRYFADVQSFNSEVDAYNTQVAQAQAAISAYNQLVVQRNAIASELASLDKSLDTRLSTQATQ